MFITGKAGGPIIDPDLALFRKAAGLARAFALFRHGLVEAVEIDRETAFAGNIGGQIDRETKGIVQAKHGLAIDYGAVQPGDDLVQHLQALCQGFGEALFFVAQDLLDMRPGRGQFGPGSAHDFGQRADQFVEEGFREAELVAMPRRAADDAAQDIAAPFVGGQHAIGDQEGRGADVIGHHAAGGQLRLAAAQLFYGPDDVLEELGVVVVMHALHDGRDALKAHAGVHRGAGDGVQSAAWVAIVLRKDQVPDLDVAIQFGRVAAGRAARDLRAVVIEDLAARAAGAGVAHGPEVFFFAAIAESARVNADLVQPDVGRLPIVLEHGDPEPFLGQF